MGGFGGGWIEHPRQRLGAQWDRPLPLGGPGCSGPPGAPCGGTGAELGRCQGGALTMREARGRRSRWRIPPRGSRAAAGRCRSRAASAPPGATRAPRAAWRPPRTCGAAHRPRSAERACSSCPSQRRALGLGLRARRGSVGVGRRVGPRALRAGRGLWRRAACPASTREGSGGRSSTPAADAACACWATALLLANFSARSFLSSSRRRSRAVRSSWCSRFPRFSFSSSWFRTGRGGRVRARVA